MPHTDERGALRPVAAAALWTVADARAFFGGCSRSALSEYIAMGLPTIRPSPRRLLFDPAEVRAWVAARQSHSILAPRARERAG